MNKNGLVLHGTNLAAFERSLLMTVKPLAARLYPHVGRLVKSHGFLVHYGMQSQRSLAAHFDESDVTLNVCLGGRFTGGTLVFTDDRDRRMCEISHEIGKAVLHLGEQVHRAKPLASGRRSNLILWCSAARRKRTKAG
jgi:predicted 2-oxoglutarate/Fe(II)-dependent dioxygenase YbiX